jgi:hypothetical protein
MARYPTIVVDGGSRPCQHDCGRRTCRWRMNGGEKIPELEQKTVSLKMFMQMLQFRQQFQLAKRAPEEELRRLQTRTDLL